MNIKIAIPSKGRPNELNAKTLLTLHHAGIDPSNIYVFVVADEEDLYRNSLIKSWYKEITTNNRITNILFAVFLFCIT